MLTSDQIEEWGFTPEQTLNNKVMDLRYYLAIENAKIVEAEKQKAKHDAEYLAQRRKHIGI